MLIARHDGPAHESGSNADCSRHDGPTQESGSNSMVNVLGISCTYEGLRLWPTMYIRMEPGLHSTLALSIENGEVED